MDLLRELFDWVAAQASLTSSIEWHCGHLPPEGTGPMAVLLERGGISSQPVLRGNVGEYNFQVLTVAGMDASYFATKSLADRIHAVLSDCAGVALSGHEVWVIDAQNEPQFIGMDDRFRFQLSANYILRGNDPNAFN